MKSKLTYFIFFSGLFFIISCSYFQKAENQKVIAKAGNAVLYENDIPKQLYAQASSQDSLANINQFIEKWALQKLLLENAKFNLPQKKQLEFDQMAKDYQIQLYINAYKDALIEKNLSTTFDEDSIQAYYDANKENFKLKEELLKLRYVIFRNDLQDADEIKDKFFSYTENDREFLENKMLEFKLMMLNDSVWIRALDIKRQMPNIQDDFVKYMNLATFQPTVLQDSLFNYLMHIEHKLNTNDVPPLSYLKPTIIQILENKKKLELNKQLEKNILNDATQNDDFKIY